jgi:hypothetical protein
MITVTARDGREKTIEIEEAVLALAACILPEFIMAARIAAAMVVVAGASVPRLLVQPPWAQPPSARR